MTVESEWQLRELRYSRSNPPARAAEEPRRREVYNAALQQFEELLTASRVAGPASKPLPLFYALSQAGRAIVAAWRADANYEIRGHGLAENRSDDPAADVLHRRIVRKPSKHATDAFGAVSSVLGLRIFSDR